MPPGRSLADPFANVFTIETALAQMQAAFDRAPTEDFRCKLGVAHYRLGKFQNDQYAQALELLKKCRQDRPMTLAFAAMTQHQLGHKAEARATLTQLRKLLKIARGPRTRKSGVSRGS